MRWWPNDRMRSEWGVFQNSDFLATSKITLIPPHFVILHHFRMAWNENINGEISFTGHSLHFYSIPITFIIPGCCWNDGMRLEWGIFLKRGKTLNSKISIIPLSSHHSMSLSHSWYDHSIHLSIIPNFYFANQPLDAIQLSTKKSSLAKGLKSGQNDLWMKGTGVVSIEETTPVPFIQRSFCPFLSPLAKKDFFVESCIASRGWFAK